MSRKELNKSRAREEAHHRAVLNGEAKVVYVNGLPVYTSNRNQRVENVSAAAWPAGARQPVHKA